MSYSPHPIDLDSYQLPNDVKEHFDIDVLDSLAEQSHLRWAKMRLDEGWTYGPVHDSNKKENPLLVPYTELPEKTKQENRRQIIDAIRIADGFGFTVEHGSDSAEKSSKKNAKTPPVYWQEAVEQYWSKPNKNAPLPEFSLPVILGLVGQNVDFDENKVKKAIDKLMNDTLSSFRLNVRSAHTPFYLLSELLTPLERFAANYIRTEYNISCIAVIRENDIAPDMPYVRCSNTTDYIASNCMTLIALWDGLSTSCCTPDSARCCDMVGKTLRENFGVIPMSLETEAPIGDTRPVFNIILPGRISDSRDMTYKIRSLLPHVLETGENWYYLDRQYPDTDKPAVRIADPEYMSEYKEKRFAGIIRTTNQLNKRIARSSVADKTAVYDMLDKQLHGMNMSADAANIRFIRLDSLASALQASYKKKIGTLSLLAAFALLAFTVISDLGDVVNIHSAFSAGLGVISVVLTVCALVLLLIANSRRLSLNTGHNYLRLLAECMRVQTYWNITGLSDHNADEGMDAKSRTELEFAVCALRGWRVLDEAAGYYLESNSQPMFIDENVSKWLGVQDEKTQGTYVGSRAGQLGYARKTHKSTTRNLKREEKTTGWFEGIAAFLTVAFSALLVFKFVNAVRSGTWSFDGIGSLFEEMYSSSDAASLLENIIMVLIGALPIIAGCTILYISTRKNKENSNRYRWLAVQYQKLIWEYDRLTVEQNALTSDDDLRAFKAINSSKREVLLRAGKVGIAEACEWSCLMSDSNAESPFQG